MVNVRVEIETDVPEDATFILRDLMEYGSHKSRPVTDDEAASRIRSYSRMGESSCSPTRDSA